MQTAVLPGVAKAQARRAVEEAAKASGAKSGYELMPALCQYIENGRGTQILFGEGAPGFGPLARALSKSGRCPVLLCWIYDGETWGYDLWEDGAELDRFDPVPDQTGPAWGEWRPLAGNVTALTRAFPWLVSSEVEGYLGFWTDGDRERPSRRAYAGDRFLRGDCWQMTDFLARLGWDWPFEAPLEEQETAAQPTLEEILKEGIAGVPGSSEGLLLPGPITNLPTCLDPAYILRLLERHGEFEGMTPGEVVQARQKAREELRHPSFQHIDPDLAMVSAFCSRWLGWPVQAFYDLYEARAALYDQFGSKPLKEDHPELLRAISMVVPVAVKVHIAEQSLTRLMAADPENRDVYLLSLAWVCANHGSTKGKTPMILAELKELGVPSPEDPRVRWEGFSAGFRTRIGRAEPPSGGERWRGNPGNG